MRGGECRWCRSCPSRGGNPPGGGRAGFASRPSGPPAAAVRQEAQRAAHAEQRGGGGLGDDDLVAEAVLVERVAVAGGVERERDRRGLGDERVVEDVAVVVAGEVAVEDGDRTAVARGDGLEPAAGPAETGGVERGAVDHARGQPGEGDRLGAGGG